MTESTRRALLAGGLAALLAVVIVTGLLGLSAYAITGLPVLVPG